jgi:hypothetical protein
MAAYDDVPYTIVPSYSSDSAHTLDEAVYVPGATPDDERMRWTLVLRTLEVVRIANPDVEEGSILNPHTTPLRVNSGG